MVIRWLHAHTEICIELCMCLYMYISPGKVHVFNQITKSICGTHSLSGGSMEYVGRDTHILGPEVGWLLSPCVRWEAPWVLFGVWHTCPSLCANIFLMTVELTDVGCWDSLLAMHGPVNVWVSRFILVQNNFKRFAPGILDLIIIVVIGVVLKYFSR